MLVDHVGLFIFRNNEAFLQVLCTIGSREVTPYFLMRAFGRLAFPIFAFLVVEGFVHTRNPFKYGRNLLLFAFISERPWNLVHSGTWHYPSQNVFFTLFIGFVTMMVLDYIEGTQWQLFAKALLSGMILLAGACLAEVLGTDYGARGVLAILALYLFRRSRSWQLVAGCAAFLWEMPALIGFIPIAFYNGKRGMKLKYFFYAFYPVHLLILYLIAVVVGVGGYAAW
jgi:hypothetical protein